MAGTETLITADYGELREISQALLKWSAVTREPMGKVLREEMGLVLKRVMQAYPPFATILQSSFSRQATIGKLAVARDIGRVYVSVQEVFDEIQQRAGGVTGDKRLARAWYGFWKRGEYEEMRQVLTALGSDYASTRMEGALDPVHHQRRRTRYGRVRSSRVTQIVGAGELARYRREVQQHVMWAKAGWLPGALRFRSKGIPAVILRQGGSGMAIDQSRRANDPRVEARNLVRYAGLLEARGRWIPRVLQQRVAVIERKAAAVLEKGWKPRGR